MKVFAFVALFFVAVLFLTIVPESTEAAKDCPCPQCIIFDPVCAYSYSPRQRRGFSSECHMHCYNRCHGTSFMKSGKGTNCY